MKQQMFKTLIDRDGGDRLTKREQQILEWIKADPMISQEALAKRAGIARSSVAVHISNLMKQGLIAGKGYGVSRQLEADTALVEAGRRIGNIHGQSDSFLSTHRDIDIEVHA